MKKRYRKRKTSYLLIFVIVLLSISTGYAALNSTLIIMGTSAIQKNIWDIHFENLNIKDGSVTATTEPTITDSNRISNFTFVLDKRGDFYEFTVDVVNNGSLDAMIDSIEKTPTLTSEQEKYLTYKITYENGEEIKKNQLLKVNDFVRIKVRVEFKSNITASDLPQTQQVLNLGFHINYIQAEDNGDFVDNNGKLIKIVSGTGINTGDEVCFGKECFYVISSTYEKITMLAKYNLYVGGEFDSSWIAYGNEVTGIQDSMMLGYHSSGKPYKGTTPFSSTNYWSSSVSSYPEYIYNSDSILYGYVENYKMYLQNLGVNIKDSRLIKLEELEALGCSSTNSSCSSAPSWVRATSYWTGNVNATYSVWYVLSKGDFTITSYSFSNSIGCRPVIEIDRSILPVEPVTPVANGSLDAIGTIVTIGTEQFYTIGIEGENVKLLSMNNLHVGGSYDRSTGNLTLYGEEATGIQISNLERWFSETTIEGTTQFSNTGSTYSGSIVEGYVNNYKNLLKLLFGVNVLEARLITYDELTNSQTFNCAANSYCPTTYPWIYSTSYWTGTASDLSNIWRVSNTRNFNAGNYSNDNFYGVRPVIIMPKSDIVVS